MILFIEAFNCVDNSSNRFTTSNDAPALGMNCDTTMIDGIYRPSPEQIHKTNRISVRNVKNFETKEKKHRKGICLLFGMLACWRNLQLLFATPKYAK